MVMMSKSAMIHSLFLSGVLVPFGATAHADNINTSGVSCHSFHAADALDISYLTNGVYNNNAASRDVICPVPRSPLASTPFTSFYVDGINAHNTSTSCTVNAVTRCRGVPAACRTVKAAGPPTGLFAASSARA